MNDHSMNPIRLALDECLTGLAERPSLRNKVLEQARGEIKVKKKLSVGFVLVIVLVLATVTALAVGALTGFFRLKQSDVGSMRGCVSTGDALYLMSSSGFCRWTPGEETPTMLISLDEMNERGLSFEALPYLDGDTIGLLDTDNKKIWHYRDHELALLLDYAGTTMDMPQLRYKQAVYQDGGLFLLAYSARYTERETFFYRVNPLTGDAEQMSIPTANINELCAYEPGKLLVLVSNAEQRSESILVLDTATGAVGETLFTAPIQRVQGLAYHKELGGLYALVGGALSHWNGTDWTVLNGAAPGFLADSFAVITGGYVSVSFDEMQYLPFSPENSLSPLKIRGYISGDNADADFQEVYGTAVVRERDPALTAKAVREAIEAGDTTDLFHVRLDADLVEMIRDGLVAPLTTSKVLVTDAQAITPIIQKELFHDGQLYAVPSIMHAMVWQGECAIPETYGELLSKINVSADKGFSISWNDAESPWTKENHVNYLLETFIAQSTRDGGTVDFHEETFANALATLRNMKLPSDTDASSQPPINPAEIVDLGGAYPDGLPESGERFYDSETVQPDEPHWLLPPTIANGAKPSIPVRVIVYLLNPNAQNPEAAMAYLEYIAAHRDPGDEGLLKPDDAKPVLHPAMERMIQFFIDDQRQSDDEAGITTDEVLLEAQMDAIRAAPDSWAITENNLDEYKKRILPYLDLRLNPLLSISAKQEGGVYQRLLQTMITYINGNVTIDECVAQLETIVNE